MQIKYLKTVLNNGDCQFKITHLDWAPNNEKLAVATTDKHILLFDADGKRRDKFSTKPADSAAGKKSYIIKGLAFSPDSTKLAVGQSDNILYVYKLGEDWGAKKSICNKILQTSPITCLLWLTRGLLICGLCDGKVQKQKITSNKSSTLSSSESLVIALCSNVNGNGFLSGHINGNVMRFIIDESNGEKILVQNFLTHSTPPYILIWSFEHVFIAGCNKRVSIYDERGKLTKTIDYNKEGDQSFTVGCCSPSGQFVMFGSQNKLRIFSWNTKMSLWNELPSKNIKNLYTVTAMSWSYDGSKIACGTIGGLLLYFESVMKRTVWKNLYVINYIGPSQILLKSISDGKEINVKSYTGKEIDDVKILGQDNFIVARTNETLIVGDLHRKLISEVLWNDSGRNEKFYFENPDICLVFNVGELSLIEYGDNNLLGSVRTELANPHLISVRTKRDNKKQCILTYLLDLKTICVMNLINGNVLAQISHEVKIDWLELSESMTKLLFRDIKQRLMLVNMKTMKKSSILSGVSFVQWIEGSDVAVAQRGNRLAVWYNIDLPDHPTIVNVQGNVIDVIRNKEKTQAIAMDGNNTLIFDLDDGLVEFGTAMHENDYGRAIIFLETVEDGNQTKSMWHNLSNIALEKQNLLITARCYAAMGNVARTNYFQKLQILSKEYAKMHSNSYESSPEIMAKIALLDGNLYMAENLYVEHGELEKALGTFKAIHKWDIALKLADKIGYKDMSELKKEYVDYLTQIDRSEKMAEIYKNEGNIEQSATLYLKSKRFIRATNLLLENFSLFSENVITTILKQLVKNEYFEAAAQIYEKMDNKHMALECYKRANIWIKAIELVRITNPSEVTSLEEEWGDYLMKTRQLDAAINHYIEAGKTVKALEAAVGAAQWKKAIHIMQVIDEPEILQKYSTMIAKHFFNNKDYSTVEKIYLRAEMFTEIVDMYNDIHQWEKGFQIAKMHLEETERVRIYTKMAEKLEAEGKLKDAEKIYVLIDSPDLAIAMYKRTERYESMLRLIEFYHPEYLETTRLHIAQDLEANGKYRKAETYYLAVGKWKDVVNMYRGHGMWEEAYRVARDNEGPIAAIQVAFLWAKSLPVESAIKLLNKYGILESSIDYACEIYDFDFAFKLCKNLNAKVKEVHYKHAMALEDEGKYSEAESEFIAADKGKEAVLMYIHGQNWINALRVAESYEPTVIAEVLTAQAMHCFKDRQYLEFESLLLRAQMPELIIETYKKSEMWAEAIRICKEYLPNYLPTLQSEANLTNPTKNKHEKWQSTVSELVTGGHYKQAVLVMVDATRTMSKQEEIRNILLKACEVVNKFILEEEAPDVVSVLAPRLIECGEYLAASQLYINVDMMKEALDTLVLGEEWTKAKQLAKELNPTYVNYVENKQKDKLLKQGNADHLFDIDILGALDLLVEQGQWNKCLEKAKQHGSPTLHKYVAQYAAHLLQNSDVLSALNLYTTYGAPALPQNLNIYNRIATYLFAMPNISDDYNLWDELRKMLYNLTEGLNAVSSIDKDAKDHFITLLSISHYYAIRAACRQITSLQFLGTKISVALLRYTTIIPVDKAFYEAGIDVRKEGRTTEAFVFLNHYLDVCEVIEESSQTLDYTDFQQTDFPNNVPIPSNLYLQDYPEEHDNIKEWVLTISMDQGVDQELPLDKRGFYESSLTDGEQQCIISGYPIDSEFVSFANGYFALKDVWSKVHMVSKMSPESNIAHTCSFILKWCGPLH